MDAPSPLAATSRSPTFPFGLDKLKTYAQDPDVRSLRSAAQSGDVTVIDRVEERFGGARYDGDVAHDAIEAGNLAFFERYLMLCRWHLILTDTDPDRDRGFNWFWAYYLCPFYTVQFAHADTRYKAVRIIVEKFLPCLPEHNEVVFRENRLFGRRLGLPLPEFRDTIWSLDNFHTLVNDYHGQRLMRTFVTIDEEEVYRYLAEEVGLKFDCDTLKSWSLKFNPRIYQFVLDHLDPSIDKNSLPNDCLYFQKPPNDADFFSVVMECFDYMGKLRSRSDHHVIQFLEHHPHFIPKIPSLKRELQNVDPVVPFLKRKRIPDAIYPALCNPAKIPDILRFLEQIQNQIPNAVYEEPFDIYCRRYSAPLDDWLGNFANREEYCSDHDTDQSLDENTCSGQTQANDGEENGTERTDNDDHDEY